MTSCPSSHISKARLIAWELGRDDRILAIILFGSVAKGLSSSESDLDLLIITKSGEELYDEVYEMSFKYDIPIEAIFLSLDGFLAHITQRTTLILGVLEGYEVLHDQVGLAGILPHTRDEIRREFIYDEEAEAYLEMAENYLEEAKLAYKLAYRHGRMLEE